MAGAATYMVKGKQYVAVLAGWGGAFALSADGALIDNMHPVRNISRLLVFKLGGTAALPEEPDFALAPLDPPLSKASAEVIELGRTKYARYCAVCHAPGAVGSTELPDLRRSGALENRAAWMQIVHGGALSDNGMASFAPSLSEDEVEAVRQYVIKRANEDKAMEAERAKTRVARR